MLTIDQLAQLAAAAYRQTSAVNRIQPPANWTLLRSEPEGQQTSGNLLGFAASAYRGPGGQVVVAFTGTNDWADWPSGSFPAAVDVYSSQGQQHRYKC